MYIFTNDGMPNLKLQHSKSLLTVYWIKYAPQQAAIHHAKECLALIAISDRWKLKHSRIKSFLKKHSYL